jgi:pimeloyl-ACP methyl ester carboxylesterase
MEGQQTMFTRTPHGKRKILFIHGLYLNSHCWEPWIIHYKAAGYDCYAPAWPYHNELETAKKSNNMFHDELHLQELFDMYAFVIKHEIREPPVVISHGTGTIMAQHLALSGLAERCICLAPYKESRQMARKRKISNLVLRVLHDKSYRHLSFSYFIKNFTNTLDGADACTFFKKYVSDENIFTESNIKSAVLVPDKDAEAPIPFMFISGACDKVAGRGNNLIVFKKFAGQQSKYAHHVLRDYCHMSFFVQKRLPHVWHLVNSWLEDVHDRTAAFLPSAADI